MIPADFFIHLSAISAILGEALIDVSESADFDWRDVQLSLRDGGVLIDFDRTEGTPIEKLYGVLGYCVSHGINYECHGQNICESNIGYKSQ